MTLMFRALTRGFRRAGIAAALFCFAGAGPLATPATAQNVELEGIAAVVNDEVISNSAVNGRIALALFAAGQPNTPENRQRLIGQVLQTLIDEELGRQEADRLGLSVPDDNVAEAISTIAANNGMSRAQLEGAMAERGVAVGVLEDQVRANMLWRTVVERRIIPRISVTPDEVDEIMTRMEDTRGLPEYLLSDLFLLVDDPALDGQVRSFAAELADDIRGGSSFSAVAAQFSDGAGASVGGDMGWVLGEQLDPAILEAVETLQVGGVSDPVRTAGGYHLVLLRDSREANTPDPLDDEVALARLILPLQAGMSRAAFAELVQIAEDASATLTGCEDLRARAEELGAPDPDGGVGPIRRLPPQLAEIVADLPVGQPTEPIRAPDSIVILMLCDRTPADEGTFDRVYQSMREERADQAQQRLLRDLRNAAYIDIRIL